MDSIQHKKVFKMISRWGDVINKQFKEGDTVGVMGQSAPAGGAQAMKTEDKKLPVVRQIYDERFTLHHVFFFRIQFEACYATKFYLRRYSLSQLLGIS